MRGLECSESTARAARGRASTVGGRVATARDRGPREDAAPPFRGGLRFRGGARGVPRRWVRGRARSSGTRDEPGPRPAAAPARTSAGAEKRSDRSGAQHRGCPRAPAPAGGTGASYTDMPQ